MEIKFNPPSRFTKAAFKEKVKVIGETKGDTVEYDVYVQTSRDEDNVKWVEAGEFLFTAFEDKLMDKSFFDDAMYRYETKKRKELSEKE